MKVLIISSNAFSQISNNGKTYESIFSSFDQTEIFQLFLRPHDMYIDYNYASKYYLISEIDIIKKIINPFNKCGKEITVTDINENIKLFKVIKKIKLNNNMFLRDILWSTRLWKTRELKKWSHEINVDAIFVVGGNSDGTQMIGRYLSNYLNIPLVTFFTDDYILYPLHRSLFSSFLRMRIIKFYLKTINSSSLLFCIGKKMADEYSIFFKKSFFPIMNSVDIKPYTEIQQKDIIIISYFGGLHLNRWQMILRFANITPINTSINVYTHSELTRDIIDEFNKNNIKLYNKIQGNDLHNAMINSDVLLHIESDDKYYRALTKLSISTKIPEYLIAGRLVIGFGPKEIASMCLLAENHIGLVISSDETELVNKNILNSALSDFNYIRKMGKLGYDYSIQNFNKEIISLKFRHMMLAIKKMRNHDN